MISIFTRTAGAVSTSDLLAGGGIPEDSVWIDLLNPTGEEERALERALAVEMPTHEEMREIEVSSRLYQEGEGTYMTATVLAKSDTSQPESTVVTFILVGEILVTLRYGEPVAGAHHRAQETRRARIPAQALRQRRLARIEGFDGRDIVGEQRRQVGRSQQAMNAASGLAGLLRFLAGEIVAADAGMAVEQEQRSVFGLQMRDDAAQHDMLEDVGEIAGVIDMAVVHGGRT